MVFLRKNIFFIINLISILFAFCFLMNHMQYDILIGHCTDYVFIKDLLKTDEGRYIGRYLSYFFYQYIPSRFPNYNINDIHSTIVASVKSVMIIFSAIFISNSFFVFKKNKMVHNWAFAYIFIISIFLIYNDYNALLDSYNNIIDSVAFFNYSFTFLLFFIFLIIFIRCYVLSLQISILSFLLFCIYTFFIFLSHEIICFYTFSLTFFILIFELIKKYFKSNSLIQNTDNFFNVKKLSVLLCIETFGILFYFFNSNYKTLEAVGGAHKIDYIESFDNFLLNILPFFQEFKEIIFLPFLALFYLIFILFFIIIFIKSEYKTKYLFFILSYLISFLALNLLFAFVGKTCGDFHFWITYKNITYAEYIFILFILFSMFGYVVSILEKKSLITSIFIILLFPIFFISLVNKEYFINYSKTINIKKEKKKAQYIVDFIFHNSIIDNILIIPIDLYQKLAYIQLYNWYIPDSNYKLIEEEVNNKKSRVFSFSHPFNENEKHYALFLFYYFQHVYDYNPKAIIFAEDKYVNQNIFPYKIEDLRKTKSFNFSGIKKRTLNKKETERLLKKSPQNPYLYLQQAYINTKNINNEDITQLFNQAIKLDNELKLITYLRGLYFLKKNKMDLVIKDFSSFLSTHPKSIMILDHYAKLLISQKKYEEAINVYSHLISFFPYGTRECYDFYYLRGNIYAKYLKKHDVALLNYLKSDKFNMFAVHYEINKQIGKIYLYKKNYKEAIKYLENELEYNNEKADTYYYLGLSYYNINNYVASAKNFISYLSLINLNDKNNSIQIKEIKKLYDSCLKNKLPDNLQDELSNFFDEKT